MNIFKKLFSSSTQPPESARTLSRNAPCWCGSNKKYKQCHYEKDRSFFTSKQNEACSGPT